MKKAYRRVGRVVLILLPLLLFSAVPAPQDNPDGARFDPVIKKIEGWTVHIDPAMLSGEHAEEGARSLRMLRNNLERIDILVQGEPLKKMRKLGVWIEHRHPVMKSLGYHPGAKWLRDRGYDPRMAQKVFVPRAVSLLSRIRMMDQPMVVLHEFAHAYHDQVLGFDYKPLIDAYEKAKEAGIYEKVLRNNGRQVKHYGITNHREYFAEATEAYFYKNDFYPFVRAELKEYDPALHDVMVKVWGPLR